ncbi:tyrosine-type recombinase/integrase [Virgibacillus pantothenticus]|nr:integrase [Virgibacillus sp. 6R]MBS7429446.1 tyrosine-type recombinase/integrase [Virgibacillus sp. 19R1-5]MBU8567816.1 tyrosine-type recombinase/integrase [Virgibacillus pantothenticus]MBU8601609.1 tyrosine-type recombinase/integrase [Virgibacillus pantothenticus]MBU8635924.1 tyrosine-type recombinase/integrase [Virgibacillus pantothenticus]
MLFPQAIDEFLFYLQVEKNYSDNTLRSYAYDLELFHQFLVNHNRSLKMHEQSSSTSRRFIQEQILKHKIQPRTLQRRISCLKSFSKYAIQENWLKNDFMANVQVPKSDQKLPVYMSLSQLQQLFSFLEQDVGDFALRNETMFKLLATTGMRRQELVDLTWEQIDFDTNTIRVIGKRRKERLLPLHDIVVPLLIAYKKSMPAHRTYPTEPIFLSYRGTQIDPRGLHSVFKKLLKQAGLPPERFSLHHLRHTFATILLNEEDVDLKVLQELLGHESLSTTGMYTHINMKQKRKVMSAWKL